MECKASESAGVLGVGGKKNHPVSFCEMGFGNENGYQKVGFILYR
jgi:hypothetical protein